MDKGNLFILGASAFFLLAGLGGAYPVWRTVQRGFESTSWPMVRGEVVRSVNVRSRRGLAEVRYRYVVGGRTLQGTRIAWVPPMFGSLRPQPHERYAMGQPVTVYHDPDDPTLAVLEPGASVGGIVNKGFVLVLFVGIGGAGVLYGIRREWS